MSGNLNTEELNIEPPDEEANSKLRFVESLKYPKGRREFYKYILEELKGRRVYIETKLGFLLKGQLTEWIDDMKNTADKVRENWPKSAEAIDLARKRVEKLLEEANEQ